MLNYIQNMTLKIKNTWEISFIGLNTYFAKKNNLFIEM